MFHYFFTGWEISVLQNNTMEVAKNETDMIFVLQHGNNGAPGDWIHITEALQKQFGNRNPLVVRR